MRWVAKTATLQYLPEARQGRAGPARARERFFHAFPQVPERPADCRVFPRPNSGSQPLPTDLSTKNPPLTVSRVVT